MVWEFGERGLDGVGLGQRIAGEVGAWKRGRRGRKRGAWGEEGGEGMLGMVVMGDIGRGGREEGGSMQSWSGGGET